MEDNVKEVKEVLEQPKLTIQDMPNEMLVQILKWVEDEQDLENAQQVCPLWHAAIDECVGREVGWTSIGLIYTGRNDDNRMVQESEHSISEVGIRHLTICLPEVPSICPSLKFPHLLRSLILFWAPHPDIFGNLVKGAVNIFTLILSNEALQLIRSAELEHLNLPNLQDLEVGKEVRRKEEAAHSLSPKNLRLLLSHNSFPRLSYFSVNFRLSSVHDLETIRLLLHFLHIHSSCLSRLDMTIYSPEQLRPSDQGTFRSSLEAILTDLQKEVKYHRRRSSLNVLCLHAKNMFLCPGRSNPQLDILKKILIRPSSLQELYLDLQLISNELLQEICSRNGATLKKVTIKQSTTNPVEILNLGVFSLLRSLQKLCLQGHQEFSRAMELPPTLICLNLEGAIRGEDIDHVLLHLPTLHTIFLKIKCIQQEGYDVRLESLKQFVRNRRVKRLRIFSDSFSSADSLYEVRQNILPEEGLANGDPDNPRRLHCKGRIFEVELNQRGYYSQSRKR